MLTYIQYLSNKNSNINRRFRSSYWISVILLFGVYCFRENLVATQMKKNILRHAEKKIKV